MTMIALNNNQQNNNMSTYMSTLTVDSQSTHINSNNNRIRNNLETADNNNATVKTLYNNNVLEVADNNNATVKTLYNNSLMNDIIICDAGKLKIYDEMINKSESYTLKQNINNNNNEMKQEDQKEFLLYSSQVSFREDVVLA